MKMLPLEKLLHSRNRASKGATLIIVLAHAPALGLAYFSSSPALVVAGRNTSIEIHQGKGTAHNAQHPMATTACRFISSAVIVTPGTFYKAGDILDPLFGNLCGSTDDYGFRLQITSVASPGPGCVNGGCVTGVSIVPNVGIGYSAPPANPVRFGGS